MYSAIVLDQTSHDKLIKWLHENFSIVSRETWEVIAHHMTIKMGELPSYLVADLNTEQTIEVTGYGSSDKVIAVRVAGYYTSNKVPHVTLAVNRKGGGKPVMSNDIKNWQPMLKPFKLKGIVKELK
jgi:hypothetical protein